MNIPGKHVSVYSMPLDADGKQKTQSIRL